VGDEISGGLDPVLARIATFAPGRHDALLWLDRTLAETSVGEIPTNAEFLRRVLNHESFRAGQYDVGFTGRLGA
jgi:acetyl/propionyl-CoA carboxylase alpha subunit